MRGTLPLMGETTFHSNNPDIYVLGGRRPLRRRCLLACCSCLTSGQSSVEIGATLYLMGKCTTARSLKLPVLRIKNSIANYRFAFFGPK